MRPVTLLIAFMLVTNLPVAAQVTEATLRERIQAADEQPNANNLLQAANAARLLRDFELAGELYDQAWQAVDQLRNGLITNTLLFELASGGGVDGIQRAFREVRQQYDLAPGQIVNLTNNYPTLLVGGEFDELIESLSPDAADPRYRCNCFAQKAWVHRVAGRMEESQMYWDSLMAAVDQNPPQPPDNLDLRAQLEGQRARNLARAGRTAEAREVLEAAMAMEVSEEALPVVRRRWAQAFAELGDVEGAVEQLEPLLSAPSLVTVHTLETRWTWEPIRNDAAFKALLDRHR